MQADPQSLDNFDLPSDCVPVPVAHRSKERPARSATQAFDHEGPVNLVEAYAHVSVKSDPNGRIYGLVRGFEVVVASLAALEHRSLLLTSLELSRSSWPRRMEA